MIRVTVEMLPHGSELHKRELGTMEIDLREVTPDHRVGGYGWRIFKWGKGRRTWRKGYVFGHDRRKRGPWDLLYRCLADAVGDRNRMDRSTSK